MRHIKFRPEKSGFLTSKQANWWANWSKRAQGATARLLDSWRKSKQVSKLKFDEQIWRDLKTWLLDNFFYGKCGYCEAKIPASFGGADHYRPKRGVTVKKNGKPERVMCPGGSEHRGYFWLAYDWKNLVPACERCNSGAKGTLFPVKGAHSCTVEVDSDTLNEEEAPLLLHPYFHKPTDDLEFMERGEIKAKNGSELGQRTIETYQLDRSRLNSARDARQQDAEAAFHGACFELAANNKPIAQSMERYTGPDAPYSESVNAYIHGRRVLMSQNVKPDEGGAGRVDHVAGGGD